MYSLVLVMTLSGGTPAAGASEMSYRAAARYGTASVTRQLNRHGCHGCHGCCGCWGGCYGCCGGCWGGWGCHGCWGGYSYGCGGCSYGCGGCWGGVVSYGCYGGGYGYSSGYYMPSAGYNSGYYLPARGTISTQDSGERTDRRGTGDRDGARDRGTGDRYGARDRDGNRESRLNPNRASIVVHLPADAKLMIEGKATKSTSATRTFVSPTLEQGREYTYTLKAEAVRGGKPVTASKDILVRAGQETSVALEFPGTSVASK